MDELEHQWSPGHNALTTRKEVFPNDPRIQSLASAMVFTASFAQYTHVSKTLDFPAD
jgi:hypothetical protein